jgi:hypothetical protein
MDLVPTPEGIFVVANTIAMFGWLLLVVAPSSPFTDKIVFSGLLPFGLAALYWITLGTVTLAGPPEGAGFNSLEAVALLFGNKWGLLAGWVHFLCFDLLVGIQIHKQIGNRPWVRLPCLCLTFLVGPVGWSIAAAAIWLEGRRKAKA